MNDNLKRMRFSRTGLRFTVTVAFLASFAAFLTAQDFHVTDITIGPDGKPRLRYEADTNYYYILYRGPITNIVLASDLALGVNAFGELKGPASAAQEPTAFFRVLRVPINQPMDTDGDGIDDVYELQHPGILSPLNAADALEDSDGDGISNLGEYRCGTDPGVSNGPVAVANSPLIAVGAPGTLQPVQVFRDVAGTRCEVTTEPGTTFLSLSPSVASVNSTGLLQFVTQGTADIVTSSSGLTATTHVVVDATAPAKVQAPIGAAGGVLHMANGTGVSIPPQALSSSQMITLEALPLPPGTTLPTDSTMVSEAIEFSPIGLTFSNDVTVTMAVGASGVPAGYDPESALIHMLAADNELGVEADTGPLGDEDLVESVNQSYDPATQMVSAQVRHFSRRALAARRNLTETILTAPDGTTLKVQQSLKTQKPGPGPDGKYGVPNCDDNGKNGVDDAGEFKGVSGGPCTGPIDDESVPIPTRTANSISYIVLHSTAGTAKSTFAGEVSWASSDRNPAWAHYYVGKDGTIVQVSSDTDIANHVFGTGAGVNNANAIGIEIFDNVNVTHYTGRQLSAVVRLCDFLMRSYPGIVRPTVDAPGNMITHAAQDPRPPAKKHNDPTGEFRTGIMPSPSLEEIVSRALILEGRTNAVINARGGDAVGLQNPGIGGTVRLEAGVSSLENDFDDRRTTVQVPAGSTSTFSGSTARMHVLAGGTLRFTAPATLDLDGILYVGPQGCLDARGMPMDGSSGFNLNIVSDGFALIEGRILVNGTDKLSSTEIAPFNQPPFPVIGSGNGDGGNAGEFVFRGAAPGPLWVPTIITRGGDADSADANFFKPGGKGGDVNIVANANGHNDYVAVLFEGRANDPAPDQAEVGMPDYLPPPPPFNLMPVVTDSPITSGTCHVPIDSPPNYVRPLASERLALGREINSTTRVVGRDVSRFHRGIITSGGIGGAESSTAMISPGGQGGNVTISNLSPGIIKFVNGVQVISGAGAERLASVISVAGGGCGDFKYFELPSGGMGGRGALNGGPGGTGGNSGNIVIQGTIYPHTTPIAPSPTAQPILGYNGDNPNFSGGITLGSLLVFGTEGFSTSSCRGSGGSPGGASSGFPGSFGAAGIHGTTIVNGTALFP
jgi:hypothetical protein